MGDQLESKGLLHLNGVAVKGLIFWAPQKSVRISLTVWRRSRGSLVFNPRNSDNLILDDTCVYAIPDGHYFVQG